MQPLPGDNAPRLWFADQQFLTCADAAFQLIVEELKCRLDHWIYLVGFDLLYPAAAPDVLNIHALADFPDAELADAFDAVRDRYVEFPPDHDLPEDQWREAFAPHDDFCWKLREEVVDVLKGALSDRVLPFCSHPYQLGQRFVVLVLVVSAQDYLAQPHLEEAVSYQQRGLWPSFLYAIIEVFLERFTSEMSNSLRGESLPYIGRGPKELLRAAAARFVLTPARAGKHLNHADTLLHGPFDLFEACTSISTLPYEGAEGHGHLVLADRGHTAIELSMQFKEPVAITDHRKARKLLEMCQPAMWLLSADRHIYGLGSVRAANYDVMQENLFVIRFVRQHHWELMHGGTVLMRTVHGEPRLPHAILDEEALKKKLAKAFSGISEQDHARLVSLAKAASSAGHGGLIVFSAKAEAEADPKRLGRQSFSVESFVPAPEQMPSLTSIDGAVLLSPTGLCHAVGVILDGRATEKGDSSRGARFNSAMRYVQVNKDAVALVISEDGMVNIIAAD